MSRLRDMNVANEVSTRVIRPGVMKSRICFTNGAEGELESSEVFGAADLDFGNGSRYQRIEAP